MGRVAITFGILLIAVGVASLAAAEKKSPTALIPAFEGVLLVALGAVAAAKPGIRKHVMHGAALLGLLGVILPLTRIAGAISPAEGEGKPLVAAGLAAMASLSAGFVVACVESFIAARAAMKAEAAAAAE